MGKKSNESILTRVIKDCFGPDREFDVVGSWLNELSEKVSPAMGRKLAGDANAKFAFAAHWSEAEDVYG